MTDALIPQEEVIAAATAAISHTGADLHRSLGAIARAIRIVFDSATCATYSLDDDSNELVLEAVASRQGVPLSVEGTRVPVGAGVAGWVMTSLEPADIKNIPEDMHFGSIADEGFTPSRARCIPLVGDSGPVGLLEVLDPVNPPHVGDGTELLELMSRQAVVLLSTLIRSRKSTMMMTENAGRYADLVKMTSALDRVKPESRAIGARLVHELAAFMETMSIADEDLSFESFTV